LTLFFVSLHPIDTAKLLLLLLLLFLKAAMDPKD